MFQQTATINGNQMTMPTISSSLWSLQWRRACMKYCFVSSEADGLPWADAGKLVFLHQLISAELDQVSSIQLWTPSCWWSPPLFCWVFHSTVFIGKFRAIHSETISHSSRNVPHHLHHNSYCHHHPHQHIQSHLFLTPFVKKDLTKTVSPSLYLFYAFTHLTWQIESDTKPKNKSDHG